MLFLSLAFFKILIQSTQIEAPKKLLDLRLEVEEGEGGVWKVVAVGSPDQKTPLTTEIKLHPSHPVFTVTIDNLRDENSTTYYDPEYPKSRFFVFKKIIQLTRCKRVSKLSKLDKQCILCYSKFILLKLYYKYS